ncbi:MAG: hypothetical protein A3H31_00330 [Gallionellales bacterium RIFCSPLOWO2_02_FULL_57_47]|jgi:hypothetical protein|nr:MAG: hypothetical protein A3H31_00330 [Gallionellales bacterium RIFCSPLOWO2_02_FULL_57_47]OGT17967.1 MAG: hypothetical protein A3J49_06705 [Gallionellales bacterium RIFCSPHIGHO2_02_FULL_57_16]
MIRNPIDIASRVSPELSGLIETIINRLESDEPVTLATVRSFIEDDYPAEIDEAEHLHHFDTVESLVDELGELIEQFGESAAAMDFVYAFASEQLSRVIEEVVSDESRDNPPTLATIKESLGNGLLGSMVGEGALEDDEADVVVPELDNLIDRFGADALAEDFLRYE